ncbi:MAG: flippase [Candidatus Krumholzibacteriota bacterium]|nr:flippase [Candidatus Krumholzibacteriota bacterium]
MTYEKVGQAMSWNILAKLARLFAGPVSFIIVVRILGSHDWGVLSILKTISGFAMIIVALGGTQAMLKYLPSRRVRGGMGDFFKNVKRLLLLQVAAWLILLGAVWFFREELGSFYEDRPDNFNIYLVTAVALVIFKVLISMVTNILQSWYVTKRLSIVTAISNVAYLVLMMLLLKAGLGIIGYLAAGAIIDILSTVILLPGIMELIREDDRPGDDIPGIRRIMKYSLPFVVTGLLTQIVWRHSEVIFLGRYSGAEASGFFSLAYDIPQMALEFVPLTIWPIVMAGMSEVFSKDDSRLAEAIDIYYRLLFLLVIPVAAMGFAFAKPMVPLLYGNEMVPSARLTQLFFIVFSYSFLYTPMSMALYVIGKSWVNMLVLTVMAILNIGLDIALIPKYGLWGAFFPVVLILAVEVVVFRVTVKYFRPDIKVPSGFIARCYLAALPTAALAFLSSRWDSPVLLILLMILGLALLFAGFRFLNIIGEREKGLINKLPLPFKEKLTGIF